MASGRLRSSSDGMVADTQAVVSYDPFAPDVVADPYPRYRALRVAASCVHLPHRDLHVVSRYDDVQTVLRRPAAFSSRDGPAYRPVLDRSVLIDQDHPTHTRHRRAVAPHFTPRSIESLRPRIASLATELLEPLLDAGPVDVIPAVAERLPLIVVAEWTGLPLEHEEDYRRFADAYFATWALTDDAEMEHLSPTLAEGLAFFAELVRDRRETGSADDLLGALLFPPDGRAELDDVELAYFCYAMVTAGTETTRNLIGNAMLAVLEHPGEWARVVRDPELLPRFVEETLRFDSPAQGVFRTAVETVAIGDSRVPAGSRVLALLASANRDPARFADPDSFFVERRFDARPLSFGAGIHTCVGAALSRLETHTFLRALLERGVEIGAAGEPVRTAHPMLRGVDALPVTLRSTRGTPAGRRQRRGRA